MERAFRQEGRNTQWEAVAAGIAAGDDRWSGVLKLIASEYPYCTMSGVHVVEGCIVACEGIQSSFVFGGADAVALPAEPAFDAHWKSLRVLCAKLGSGRLAEIRPVDFEPLHRDTALVALSTASLDRPAVRDFANEIFTECARVGTVIENRLTPKAANAA